MFVNYKIFIKFYLNKLYLNLSFLYYQRKISWRIEAHNLSSQLIWHSGIRNKQNYMMFIESLAFLLITFYMTKWNKNEMSKDGVSTKNKEQHFSLSSNNCIVWLVSYLLLMSPKELIMLWPYEAPEKM